MEKILIIAPHPDDDVIGMGGTIFNLYKKNHKIEIVYVTNGSGSKKLGIYKKLTDKEFIETRKKEAVNSIKKLCGNNHKIKQIFLNFNSLDLKKSSTALLTKFEQLLKHDFVYIPYLKDQHLTHRIVSKSVLEAIKQNNKNIKIYEYEVWSAIPFLKNTIIEDISLCIKIKQKAIKEHKTQCLILDFDEGILGKNRYNAVFSKINKKSDVKYAEIFREKKFLKKVPKHIWHLLSKFYTYCLKFIL